MKFTTTGKAFMLICTISCLPLYFSCNFNATYNNREADRDDAEKVADAFYRLLNAEKFDDTYRLFSPRFFSVTDTPKLHNIYIATVRKLGPITDRNLENWESRVIKGTHPSADYVLVYHVNRQHYDSRETLSLSSENDSIRIVGYNVNSDGFFTPDTPDSLATR